MTIGKTFASWRQNMFKMGPYRHIGATFSVARIFQMIALIAIIGLAANFVSTLAYKTTTPPSLLIAALAVAVMAFFYVFVTYICYKAEYILFLVLAGLDILFLLGAVLLVYFVGKPLSYLNCAALPASATGAQTKSFIEEVAQNVQKQGYYDFAGGSTSTCLELKAVWGFCFALSVLACVTLICSGIMWRMKKTGSTGLKTGEA
ncbi:hypothetical protein BJ878DRAFT_26985 [Calycina marina]|uniref:MARVEL domain-containing protein n=1 Tax=Calycina marina TaxID=1763456 RepID=A0A9P8CIN7_9HELO|nr:hypothetical protein BJ878DRAFT_26985 [Calycina marina]